MNSGFLFISVTSAFDLFILLYHIDDWPVQRFSSVKGATQIGNVAENVWETAQDWIHWRRQDGTGHGQGLHIGR